MTEAKKMTEKQKSAFTPKLRFPEFNNAPGWKSQSLEQVAQFIGERVPVSTVKRSDYASTENLLPDFGGFSAPSSLPSSGTVISYRTNDILIANIRPYLKKVWVADRNGGASNDVLVVRAKKHIATSYLAHVLRNDRFIAYVMRGAKGLKMPRGDVSLIKQYPVTVPSYAEQQKIAECLSTLDELIEAERRKLDALKDHKKGLMQQLFPREGETRPRLRFPEFRSSPDWTTRRMNEIYAFLANNSFSRDRLNYVSGSIRNIHYGDIHKHYRLLFDVTREVVPYINDDALTSESQPVFCAEGDMVFADASEDLEDIGKCIEIVNLNNERVVAGLHTILARPKTRSAFARGFSGYLFSSKRIRAQIQKESQGTKVLGISAKRLANIELCFPVHVAEQERIADCLSSLDDLIAAQSEKLESLRTHKCGLMQQLFPSPDAIDP